MGPKGLARRLYEKRKTEVREGRYFPPERRRTVLFDELVRDYERAREQGNKRDTWGAQHFRRLREVFSARPAAGIKLVAAKIDLHVDSLDAEPMDAKRDWHRQGCLAEGWR